MRFSFVLSAVVSLALVGCAHTAETPASAAIAAVDNPARTAADRERDRRDQPASVLSFAGFKAADRIADIFGGGGYYSEVLSDIVGSEGQVLLINNQPYYEYAKKDLEPRLASGRMKNVTHSVAPSEAMQLGTATLDGALIVMSYHDLYVADPENGWPAIDAAQFIDQIVTALKPGGMLLIVDHSAKAGTGKADAQSLHRIDEAFAIGDFKAHGLSFDGSIEILRHPDDDRTKNVFDAAIKGKTDRFVHRYRKP